MDSVWFDGIDELNKVAADLQRAEGRIGALGSAVVRKSTLDGERIAKQLAPVDTGFLRNSITHEFRGDGRHGTMEGEWGPEAEYGKWVEWGTARTAPAAYAGPSLDRVTPDFIAAMTAISDPLDGRRD
jgi:hypothetical protein